MLNLPAYLNLFLGLGHLGQRVKRDTQNRHAVAQDIGHMGNIKTDVKQLLGKGHIYLPTQVQQDTGQQHTGEEVSQSDKASHCQHEGQQKKTGGKVERRELEGAAGQLRKAGAAPDAITAYIIIGHPDTDFQAAQDSMRAAHDMGLRVMLADFSPVPGTPDGNASREIADVDEPLWHNKTAFTIRRLGEERVQELKEMCRKLNYTLR